MILSATFALSSCDIISGGNKGNEEAEKIYVQTNAYFAL